MEITEQLNNINKEPVGLVPLEEGGNSSTETQNIKRGHHVMMEAETGMITLQAKESQGLLPIHTRNWGEARKALSRQPVGKSQPCRCLASRTVKE